MTENSQEENEKNLDFKAQILKDLADAKQAKEPNPVDLEEIDALAHKEKEDLAAENSDSVLISSLDEHSVSDELLHNRNNDEADAVHVSEHQKADDSQVIRAEVRDVNISEPVEDKNPATVQPASPSVDEKGVNVRPAKVSVSYQTSKLDSVQLEKPQEEAPLAYRGEKQTKEAPKTETNPKKSLSRASRMTQNTKKKRQNSVAKKITLTVLTLLVIALAVTSVVVYNYVDSALKPVDNKSTEYVSVRIPEGSSAKEIGSILEKKNLIKSGQVFNYYTKFKSYANFQSGYFNLKKSMSLDTIAKELQKKGTETPQDPALAVLSIPEGYTLEQIAQAVGKTKSENKVRVSEEDFLTKVQDESFIAQEVAKYPTLLANLPSKDSGVKYRLEGYLFPATYTFTEATTAESLIDQMLAAMDSNLAQYYDSLEAKNLTVNDVLTLASLVEKEGATDEDRKNIAGVFYNRLNQDMPLQSNIAILYAEGKLGQKTTLEEDAAIDTNIDSPFNIYTNTGLPPGPVDSPSLSAIEAAVNPNKTDYLYFVADTSTGTVYYSTTYEEHAENVEKYVNSKITESSSSS